MSYMTSSVLQKGSSSLLASTSARQTLRRVQSSRSGGAPSSQHRYAIIHDFFSLNVRRTAARSFTGGRAARSSSRGDDDDGADLSKLKWDELHDDYGVERHHRRDQPFHNYPRSLRELALQARAGQKQEDFGKYPPLTQRQDIQARIADASKAGETGSTGNAEKGEVPLNDGQEQKKVVSRWTRPRPPSKEELLHIAQGFWTRLRIRFKWFTIRGFRRFNADDISAFFTLGGLGTVVFIIVGTTTAVSLVFSALNALNMQEWIARKLADYLTSETGVTVIFESAIVPKWKDSRICFQNVFISRRAYDNDPDTLREERVLAKTGRRRRGTATTAGQGMAWEGTHFNEYDEEEVAPPMSDQARGQLQEQDDGRNSNFSMFDLNVDSIDVKLSFRRWWDGKGLVEDAVVEGVRGIIDRRSVHWDPDTPYDPRAARREPKYGDFELVSLVLRDFLVTVYQPGNFRPFNLSMFEAQMPRLRRQWIFYDLLSADRITGQVDGCLFSLHKPQSIGRTNGKEREVQEGRWRTLSRLRIDGINFDHIQNQSDVHGPVSWIRSGKFDVVADVKLPREASSDIDINLIVSEMIDHLTQVVSSNDGRTDGPIPGQHRLSGPAIQAPVTTVGPASEGAWKQKQMADQQLEMVKARGGRRWRLEMEAAGREASRARGDGDGEKVEEETAEEVQGEKVKDSTKLVPNAASVMIDLDVRFKDIKAAVPLFSSDLTYRTQTFVRPIVAFMNANQTLIPVHCRIVMDLSEFDGSMDLAQTGLLPIISDKIYEALANHVQSQAANNRRIRNVSHWWLRLATDQMLQYARLVRDAMIRNRNAVEVPDPGQLSIHPHQH